MFTSRWMIIFVTIVLTVITSILSSPPKSPLTKKQQRFEVMKEIQENLKISKNPILREIVIDIKPSDIQLESPIQITKVFNAIRKKQRSPNEIEKALKEIRVRLKDSKNMIIQNIVTALSALKTEDINCLVKRAKLIPKRKDHPVPNPHRQAKNDDSDEIKGYSCTKGTKNISNHSRKNSNVTQGSTSGNITEIDDSSNAISKTKIVYPELDENASKELLQEENFVENENINEFFEKHDKIMKQLDEAIRKHEEVVINALRDV